jgi:oligopeptide/dipeptide ABC transporter ATP-binding protein
VADIMTLRESPGAGTAALLEARGLTITLPQRDGRRVAVVDGVDLAVRRGEILGLAGESGSGKTIAMLAALGLLPHGARTGGELLLDGVDLLTLPERELRALRGRDVAMVFQDPMTSLHPMLSVERQLTEHTRHHEGLSRQAARARAVELLETVRIPDPRSALKAYPHQFSGGMRQRIAIASALACRPKLLIADEPTTALDVTVQAGILRLLDRLRAEQGITVVVITHDLGVMSAIADRVAVMYAGRILEDGPRQRVLGRPRHPYTRGLLDALPHPEDEQSPLRPIAGVPPAPSDLPTGCPFHPRCPHAVPACSTDRPPLLQVAAGHASACPVDPWGEVAP